MALPAGPLRDTLGSFQTPPIGPYVTSIMLATSWLEPVACQYHPPLATLGHRNIAQRKWGAGGEPGRLAGIALCDDKGKPRLAWTFSAWQRREETGEFPTRWVMTEAPGKLPLLLDFIEEKGGRRIARQITATVPWRGRRAEVKLSWHAEAGLFLPDEIVCRAEPGEVLYYADFLTFERTA